MSNDPNPQQQQLIDNVEGIYLVDAGAGTGKTFTLTRRYSHILASTDAEPEDILLVTFTENAAASMKERIIAETDHDPKDLHQAPIQTFHSFCKRVIDSHGFDAPRYLGLEERIGAATRIIENRVQELHEFRRFMDGFREEHPEFTRFYRIIDDDAELLSLIQSLCSKGIFPTTQGWYRNTEDHLEGDFASFRELFEVKNQPRQGKRGKKQSELRKRLGSYRRKTFVPDAPSVEEVRGNGKAIPGDLVDRVFDEDRERLKAFIQTLYIEYIGYALSRNYLTFPFLLMFAYILFVEDDDLRERTRFDYVMIDEFQDTNEIQFRLAMLLSGTGNIAVVGDWKQSIYSFQYASVDNIKAFEERLQRYRKDLNRDTERIPYSIDQVDPVHLVTNYRSTQQVLDVAEQTLAVEATRYESIDPEEELDAVTSLQADTDSDLTAVEAVTSGDEHEAVLNKIQHMVDNPAYMIEEDGAERRLQYSDVAVLSRTTAFGMELQKVAREQGIPVNYEGGIELFKTDPAILFLAWLRVMDWQHSGRGWAVILDQAGYTVEEVQSMLDAEDYPEAMQRFREELLAQDSLADAARLVFDRYGISNGFADRVIEVIDAVASSSYISRGGMIRFIEDNIEAGERYEVDNTATDNAVTVQTIHAAKGLEYPAVIVADMNQRRFPSTQSDSGSIVYREPLGLRQTCVYGEDGYSFVYDSWAYHVMSKVLSGRYDEERRLLYVASTRAENYLCFSAEDGRESPFFTNLPVEPSEVTPLAHPLEQQEEQERQLLSITPPERKAPVKLTPHTIMEDADIAGRGKAFGTAIHRYAEQYIEGDAPAVDELPVDQQTDCRNVAQVIDSLAGDLVSEETVLLPVDVDGRQVVFEGVADLVAVTDDAVTVIDFKTTTPDSLPEAYRTQLSIYHRALSSIYEGRAVEAFVVYTATGERDRVVPLSLDEIRDRAAHSIARHN